MYLPIIMLQRYGWPGFLVFAVPNIIGCAAFGYIVRTPERSRRLVAGHAPAMKWFSLITLAYHVFFIGFACRHLMPAEGAAWWLALAAAPCIVLVAWGLSAVPIRIWPVLAVIVYAASLAAFGLVGVEPLGEIGWSGDSPAGEWPWLAPTIAFGFLLCPYLDPTFHRAIQQSPSRRAFAVFGVGFAVMIVFTCAYADVPVSKLTWLIGGHMLAQIVFTMAAHLREVRALTIVCCGWHRSVTMLAPLAALPLAYLDVLHEPAFRGEDTYIRFLVFYGLVFPAYILLFMGPLKTLPRTRGTMLLFAVIVVGCLPVYEAGFLHHRPWLLPVVPVALVVIVLAAPRPATTSR
jgi:hypothetical protein